MDCVGTVVAAELFVILQLGDYTCHISNFELGITRPHDLHPQVNIFSFFQLCQIRHPEIQLCLIHSSYSQGAIQSFLTNPVTMVTLEPRAETP